MKINISDHFTYKKLYKFVIPSIIMMVFTSIYGVVDGFFVSNYAGKIPFASVNLVMPYLMLLGTPGFMVGTGGNALISKYMGQGKNKKANETFSLLIYFTIAIGIGLFVFGELSMPLIVKLLGASEAMFNYCVLYGRIVCISVVAFNLQTTFQSLLATAGKPQIGLGVTISAGVSNMILDFLFVGVFKWGMVGAAVATVIGETIGGIVPLVYFMSKNSSTLRLGKTRFYVKDIVKTFTNGASELMSNVSLSLVNMLYNIQLMKFYGENGVAAYGTIMYVNFVFVAAFIGYSIGSAPIIGYNYGAKNHKELQNVSKKSLITVAEMAVLLTVFAMLLAVPLAKFYVGYDDELYTLTVKAFRLFSTGYLVCGFNIFGSAFFTALNNGLISASISFVKTLICEIACVFLLPVIFGSGAIWLSYTTASVFALVFTIIMVATQNKKYHYIRVRTDS